MQIFEGSLDAKAITNAWYDEFKDKNCGALITFTGIVREEGGISALSFDIYEPILRKWLAGWEQRRRIWVHTYFLRILAETCPCTRAPMSQAS